LPGDEICKYCGCVFPFATEILAPDTILQNRYQVKQLTHTGGMGYIYQTLDMKLDNRVCIIKQVKSPVKSDNDYHKLEKEAIEMAKLHHPNVATILDHFVEGQFYFLTVEFISGKTLGELFEESKGCLSTSDVVKWAISMCDVASYLHNMGIIHQDISPQNIILSDSGAIKFIDFGTLRELHNLAVGLTAGVGKFGYAPPEQWQGHPEPRSDIFALGATIYYLLTGYLPLSEQYLSGQNPQKSDFNPDFPPIRKINNQVSDKLETVLQIALQLDINQRYESADCLKQALMNSRDEPSPILNINNDVLDFGEVLHGKQYQKYISIVNCGAGKLTGQVKSSVPWLHLSSSTVVLEPGKTEVGVTADTSALPASSEYTGNISITSDGGDAAVLVRLKPIPLGHYMGGAGLKWFRRFKWVLAFGVLALVAVTVLPQTVLKEPSLSVKQPGSLAFNGIKVGQLGIQNTLSVLNNGGRILTGVVTTNRDWLKVSPANISIPVASGAQIITVQVDSKGLSYGYQDTALIMIQTNGGNFQIPVSVSTTRLIYQDDFKDPSSGWGTFSNDTSEAKYEDNQYRISIKKAQGPRIAFVAYPPIGQLEDAIIQVAARVTSISKDTSYGLIFGKQATTVADNYYFFHISSDTVQYRFDKIVDGTWNTLIDWNDSPSIKRATLTNIIKIQCKGDKILLFVNDQEVASITDDTFRRGYVGLGLAVRAQNSSQVDSSFDDLIITYPDQLD
jgi:serine/threonine protein kinase